MKTIRRLVKRSSLLVTALAFGAAVVVPVLVPTASVHAAQLSSRTLTMTSTADGTITTDANGTTVVAGAPGNGAQTRHSFTYTHSGTPQVASMVFQYCTTPLFGTTCTAPTGLDVSTVTGIQTESGYAQNDYAIDTTTDATTSTGVNFFAADTNACTGSGVARTNCILVKDPGTFGNATGPITMTFGGSGSWLKNPTVDGTFFVRITTFSDNAFTTTVDDGAVAGSVNEQIDITARVQEKLNFSVSGVSSTPNGATCTALSGSGAEILGDGQGVLSHTQAYTTNSYFRLSTNASGGTTVQYSGDTLKTAGGTFSIDAAGGTAEVSDVGNEQFGLTIDSTDGQSGNGYSFTDLAATGNYDNSAEYAFDTGSLTTPVTIASVTAGSVVNCDTGSVKYIGNIGTTTNAGIYRTTITYFATPTF